MTSGPFPSTHMVTDPRGDFTPCAQRTLKRLRKLFPGAFGEVKPLAVGIYTDVLSRAKITGQDATVFFNFYTASAAYLAACAAPGAQRHDLDGNLDCAVSEADRQYAAARLAERSGRRRERTQSLAFKAALLEPVAIEERDEP